MRDPVVKQQQCGREVEESVKPVKDSTTFLSGTTVKDLRGSHICFSVAVCNQWFHHELDKAAASFL